MQHHFCKHRGTVGNLAIPCEGKPTLGLAQLCLLVVDTPMGLASSLQMGRILVCNGVSFLWSLMELKPNKGKGVVWWACSMHVEILKKFRDRGTILLPQNHRFGAEKGYERSKRRLTTLGFAHWYPRSPCSRTHCNTFSESSVRAHCCLTLLWSQQGSISCGGGSSLTYFTLMQSPVGPNPIPMGA